MLGIWLVGFEESPQESGEICVAELFGSARRPHASEVRLGIKAHHDPRLHTDVVDLTLDLDTAEEHTYAARWDAHRTLFYVDDRLVRTIEQGTDYPLQLMVDLFEFPTDDDTDARDPEAYPKSALVRSVRGYRPAARRV
jgi:Glycosyl hydrolases family 16